MTLSANFTSKSVFDQQGCHALTFALARLSCYFKSSDLAYAHCSGHLVYVSGNISECVSKLGLDLAKIASDNFHRSMLRRARGYATVGYVVCSSVYL